MNLIYDHELKPTKKQLEFLSWETGIFFHFGIRTFYEGRKDWDMIPMPAEGFTPDDLLCEDWCEAAVSAGATYAVLVTKHHDGFANWQTAYSDYGVKSSPWKDGRGDVVREFTDACRKYGLKVGLYYSPAQFGSVKMNSDEYDDYFVNQITELLTDYGKIDYLWFDGCGADGHEWNKDRIISVIRSLQPEILIFNMWDPDTRWCGNERGFSVYPNDYTRDGQFLPDECDCRIRDQWFWSDADKDTLKSLDELLGMYELSVGRGSNLLLNVAPDRHGRICDSDKQRLVEFGNEIKRRKNSSVSPKISSNMGCGEINFDKLTYVNAVVLNEDLTDGQKIIDVKISFNSGGTQTYVWNGTTVGNKLICSFPTIKTDKIIIETKHIGNITPKISFTAYYF